MHIQIEKTPNPDSLKFLPGKIVSKIGPIEIVNKLDTNNELIRNILSINGVEGIFLGEDLDVKHYSYHNVHYLIRERHTIIYKKIFGRY